MTAVVGLVVMGLAFALALQLDRGSPLAHRAGSAWVAGAGGLLLLADTLRPELLPWAVAALCVSLLWMALAPPLDPAPRRAVDEAPPSRLE